jgi:hypothetical protein
MSLIVSEHIYQIGPKRNRTYLSQHVGGVSEGIIVSLLLDTLSGHPYLSFRKTKGASP